MVTIQPITLNLRVVTLPVHLLPTQSSNTSKFNVVIDGLVKPNACSSLKNETLFFEFTKACSYLHFYLTSHHTKYNIWLA